MPAYGRIPSMQGAHPLYRDRVHRFAQSTLVRWYRRLLTTLLGCSDCTAQCGLERKFQSQ